MRYFMEDADISIHCNPDRAFDRLAVLGLLFTSRMFGEDSLFEKRILTLVN